MGWLISLKFLSVKSNIWGHLETVGVCCFEWVTLLLFLLFCWILDVLGSILKQLYTLIFLFKVDIVVFVVVCVAVAWSIFLKSVSPALCGSCFLCCFYFFVFKPGFLYLNSFVFNQGLVGDCVQIDWTTMASTADGSVKSRQCVQTQLIIFSSLPWLLLSTSFSCVSSVHVLVALLSKDVLVAWSCCSLWCTGSQSLFNLG